MIRRIPGSVVVEEAPRRVGRGEKSSSVVVADSIPVADSAEVEGYRKGYAEGFEAGECDGLQDAKARMQALEEEVLRRRDELILEQERLRHLIDGVDDALERHEQEMKAMAYELALVSLSQAFGHLQEDRQLLQRLCAQVAEEFRAKATRLAVSPEDRVYLPAAINGLDLIDDPAISRGVCRVVTERGYVETSIDMRLASIYRAMREALEIDSP